MVTTLNKILRGLMKKQEDTGWVSLPLSSDMSWENSGGVEARRIGNLVELSVSNVRSDSGIRNQESRLIDQLPETFRPTRRITAPFLAYPSNLVIMGGILRILSDGRVTIESSTGEPYAPRWGLFAQVTYFVD